MSSRRGGVTTARGTRGAGRPRPDLKGVTTRAVRDGDEYADARAQRIYGGTNEIMKELIARSLT